MIMKNKNNKCMRFAAVLFVSASLSLDMAAAGVPQPVYGYENVNQAVKDKNPYGQQVDLHNIATNPVDQPKYGHRALGTDLSTTANERVEIYPGHHGDIRFYEHQAPLTLPRSNELTPKQRKYYNSEPGHAKFMKEVDHWGREREKSYQKWRSSTWGTPLENTPYPGYLWEQDPFILRTIENARFARPKPETW